MTATESARPWTPEDEHRLQAYIEAGHQEAGFGAQVRERAHRLRVDQEARSVLTLEAAGVQSVPPPVDYTMADEFKEADEAPRYTIERLHVTGGNTLLSALYKSGKTALGAVTLAKQLADGEAFLEQFDTHLPDGLRVGVLNYELPPRMFRRWLRRTGIKHPERVVAWHLRGQALPFWTPEGRRQLVEWCRGNRVGFLVIDTVTKAGRGCVEDWNTTAQVDRFFHAVDVVKKEADVPDCMLIHHMGRQAQKGLGDDAGHARGSTALEDSPDALWYLTYDGGLGAGVRFLKAYGRDVDVEPIALQFDKKTGLYSHNGQSRADARGEENVKRVLEALVRCQKENGEDPPVGTLTDAMKGNNDNKGAWLREAVEDGYVEQEKIGKRKVNRLTPRGRALVEAGK